MARKTRITVPYNFRLPEDADRRLQAQADITGRSKYDLVRQIIAEWLVCQNGRGHATPPEAV